MSFRVYESIGRFRDKFVHSSFIYTRKLNTNSLITSYIISFYRYFQSTKYFKLTWQMSNQLSFASFHNI